MVAQTDTPPDPCPDFRVLGIIVIAAVAMKWIRHRANARTTLPEFARAEGTRPAVREVPVFVWTTSMNEFKALL